MNTNIITFESEDIATSKGKGSISTLQFDVDIEVIPLESDNELAPTHRVMAFSPAGKLIEVGGVWRKFSKTDGAEYFTINIRDYRFNANLGQAAHQDDAKVQAVIAWGPQEAAA